MFGGEQIKRPGDATTSRGMAPKTELRRITTIRPCATADPVCLRVPRRQGDCDGARIGGGPGGAGGSDPRDGAAALPGDGGVAPALAARALGGPRLAGGGARAAGAAG